MHDIERWLAGPVPVFRLNSSPDPQQIQERIDSDVQALFEVLLKQFFPSRFEVPLLNLSDLWLEVELMFQDQMLVQLF